ncbi:MAG: FAD-dependent thymidylate synthase [Anaerolineales bacterium]|nr:FAD-dependent thymidylate synthase [Anaerolineales bacterium]
MPSRQIYLLSPKCLSPETIAVAFAKTSRVPDSFRDIAAELSDESSSKFHEKWVVGYGHSSVAEHAVLHLALENISRLAIECIESNRLASYTEKSTRYQKWGKTDFVIPPELEGHPLREEYIQAIQDLFKTYEDSLMPVRRLIEQQDPRRPNEDDEAWDRRLRSRYVDATRFLLPGAALANVGMTANARVLENAVRKMLSHPLAEVREIGEQVRDVSQGEAPTLVKYADKVPYLVETSQALENYEPEAAETQPSGDWCRLIDYDQDGEDKVLAAGLYRFSEMTFSQALEKVRSLSLDERQELADSMLGKLGPHDIPLRELEYCHYTFDLVMDQGAYAEFKRHRMMSQTPQKLTCRLGYAIPRLITEAGFSLAYQAAMDAAAETYEKLANWNPQVAAYVAPNGFNRRVLAQFNLREAYHFCQLRAASNAHFSIRRVAQQVAGEIRSVHPLLSKYMKIYAETREQIDKDHFSAVS